MWITRLQVSGGFLDGLDMAFDRGLNVLIGGRGSGKTSVLELVRHAMDLAHANIDQEAESRKFIRAILGTGEVTVDLVDDATSLRLIVDGAGAGRRIETRNAALMVGQSELEAIASDAPSRLSLLDIRAGISPELEVPGAIGRLTRRMWEIRSARTELKDQLIQLPEFRRQLEDARARETALLSRSGSGLDADRDQLRELEDMVRRTRRSKSQLSAYEDHLRALKEDIDTVLEEVAEARALSVPSTFEEDAAIFDREARGAIEVLQRSLGNAETKALQERSTLGGVEQSLLEQSAPLKERLSEAESGLGEVAAEIRAIGSQIESLESKRHERQQLKKEYIRLAEQRNALLVDLEEASEVVFQARAAIAEEVTGQLESKAAIRVEHLANTRRFETFLNQALRGSGLQFKVIVERLVSTFLPQTLLEAVEGGSVDLIATALGIQRDRAARVLDALDEPESVSTLAELVLEDKADYMLRHGTDFKNVEELSTGQKCAVTLPILMTEIARSLLLDQPEDHLDNAFLVQTVLPGLANRRAHRAQTIVATHNANIPVLGEADRVFALESDGRRGFVVASGSLEVPGVVERISSVMEGGKDAFRRRAAFYTGHGSTLS